MLRHGELFRDRFYPWILSPVAFVLVTVFAFNALGDGLRDAIDPIEEHADGNESKVLSGTRGTARPHTKDARPVIDARKVAVSFKVENGTSSGEDVSFSFTAARRWRSSANPAPAKSVTARTVMGLLSKRATIAPQARIEI